MDIGYARVSTMKQDLDRQIGALRREGIEDRYIYIDKKSGSTTNRPGLKKALEQAREGDVIVV
ncbi:recombinase family protein, partial [Corynebacterium flavescens]|uniref:recombinase family protein n=1 Tax=Corynebacterium flavescens TaxID=28028 RepID=UPI00114204CA